MRSFRSAKAIKNPSKTSLRAVKWAPKPIGHSFFFVRDFDGNLIEMMDLGYMYHVLGWLGPLGGWLFRRGMYRKYYQ